jgi:hypothetical protein
MESRSIQRALVCYQKCLAAKKAKSIQVISYIPEQPTVNHSKVDVCEATTMSGKRCTFKSLYGTKFCKRHQIIL